MKNLKHLSIAAVILISAGIISYNASSQPTTAVKPSYSQFLPDPKLSPSANDPSVLAHVPLAVLCKPGYTAGTYNGKKVRDVSDAVKKAVFAEYHVNPASDHFEIDHICSLELGCSNSIKNLWPQSYTTKPYNAHVKDALEDHLHALVCMKKNPVPLEQAQKDIATDWIAAWKKYMPMKVTN